MKTITVYDRNLYLALDPGTTTGLAWYNRHEDEFCSYEIRGRHNLYDHLALEWNLPHSDESVGLGYTAPGTVIVERWDVRYDTFAKTNQDDPRYIIGYVEGLVRRLDYLHYAEQRPGEAKGFATNDKLRALGWYTGGEGHADDATRHLVTFLAKAGVEEILEVIV